MLAAGGDEVVQEGVRDRHDERVRFEAENPALLQLGVDELTNGRRPFDDLTEVLDGRLVVAQLQVLLVAEEVQVEREDERQNFVLLGGQLLFARQQIAGDAVQRVQQTGGEVLAQQRE